jgi:hypothetical protein
VVLCRTGELSSCDASRDATATMVEAKRKRLMATQIRALDIGSNSLVSQNSSVIGSTP